MPKTSTPKATAATPKPTVVKDGQRDHSQDTALNGLKEIFVDSNGQWRVKEYDSERIFNVCYDIYGNNGRVLSKTYWVDIKDGNLEVASAISSQKVYQLMFIRKKRLRDSPKLYVFKEVYSGRMVERNTFDGLYWIDKPVYEFLQRERKYKNFLNKAPLNGSLLPVPEVAATTLSFALAIQEKCNYKSFPTNTANKGKPYVYHGTTLPIGRCDVVSIHDYTDGSVHGGRTKNGILINYVTQLNGSGWLVDVGYGKEFSTVLVPTKDLKFVRRCCDDTLRFDGALGTYSYLMKAGEEYPREKYPTDQTIKVGDTVLYHMPHEFVCACEFKVMEIYGYGEDGLLLKYINVSTDKEFDDVQCFANINDVEFQRFPKWANGEHVA